MKRIIKKYYGLIIFYAGIIVLTLSIVNYLEQQKSVAVDTTHTTQQTMLNKNLTK